MFSMMAYRFAFRKPLFLAPIRLVDEDLLPDLESLIGQAVTIFHCKGHWGAGGRHEAQ